MARCDQGYLCRVCGKEVEDIVDSELYLRFVIGEIDPETLHTQPECHLRCNPTLAQFITDLRFEGTAAVRITTLRRDATGTLVTFRLTATVLFLEEAATRFVRAAWAEETCKPTAKAIREKIRKN